MIARRPEIALYLESSTLAKDYRCGRDKWRKHFASEAQDLLDGMTRYSGWLDNDDRQVQRLQNLLAVAGHVPRQQDVSPGRRDRLMQPSLPCLQEITLTGKDFKAAARLCTLPSIRRITVILDPDIMMDNSFYEWPEGLAKSPTQFLAMEVDMPHLQKGIELDFLIFAKQMLRGPATVFLSGNTDDGIYYRMAFEGADIERGQWQRWDTEDADEDPGGGKWLHVNMDYLTMLSDRIQ